MSHTIRRSDKKLKSVVEAAFKKNDRKSPSTSALSSGYNSVSSVPSLKEEMGYQSEHDDDIKEDSVPSGIMRKPSIVLVPETGDDDLNGESHDFEATHDDDDNRTKGIPAYDAFGETKRRGAKSYNIEQKFLKVCRLMMYMVMFSVVLCGGVYIKLSGISIATSYRQSDGKDRTRHALYLVTLMCVYPGFTMLSSFFKVIFGKVKSLSKRFIAFLMVIEVLRTIGLLLFLFKVIPYLSGINMLYVMMSAPVFPAVLSLLNTLIYSRQSSKRRIISLCFYGFIFLIQAGSLSIFYFLGVLKEPIQNEVIWVAPISVVLISLGWWENFVDFKRSKYSVFQKFGNDLHKPRDKAHLWTVSCRLSIVGICVLLAVYQPNSYFGVSNCNYKHLSNDTATTVRETTESLLTISSAPNETGQSTIEYIRLINNGTTDSVKDDLSSHIPSTYQTSNTKTDSSYNWFATQYENIKGFITDHAIVLQIIALTFLVSYCAILACKLHMQIIGFSIATLLISPITLTYTLLKCGNQLTFDVIPLELTYLCPSWELTSAIHICLAALLWISTIMLTIYVWFPHSERMAKVERMFLPELKDCIFVDFNLLLRHRKHHKQFHRKDGEGTERVVPKVYICATMWHENWKEMLQLLKSLLRIDRHCAVSRAAERKFSITTEDPDKFEPEIHIIFDDAFTVEENSKQHVPNKYVLQFITCLDEAASAILGSGAKNEWDSSPVKSVLPYGGRLTWSLPGTTKMIVHLKNKLKIRHRKRWSQVMYLYYLLGYETFHFKSRDEIILESNNKGNADNTDGAPKSFRNVMPDKYKTKLENTFILTLDGDVDFKPKSVLLLIDRMKKNVKVGAVCGRIHPIGSGPLVWYQKFEYAIGHWLQKAAEHVLGCVLCCPGCFSMFRASALIDDNVVKTYTRKPTEALHYIQFEQGEDRWLCTLLLQQGYKVDYCAGADAYTYAPETFDEFFIQRRRWSPSTNANIIDLLKSWNHTVQQNANISRLFMAYQFMMLATSLLAPATVSLMITGSYSSVLGFDSWTSYMLSISPIVIFIVMCLKCKQETQLFFAAIFSSIYTIVMIIVTIGTILNITSESVISPNVLFLVGLVVIFTLSALWHPKEFSCLLHGLLYYVAVPSTFIFLTIYYICNLNIVTWGTREDKQANTQKKPEKKKKLDRVLSAFKSVLNKQSRNNKSDHQVKSLQEELNEINIDQPGPENENIDTFTEDKSYWMSSEEFKKYKTENDSQTEETFWTKLIHKYLLPIEGNKQHEQKIKSDLLSLRNNIVFAFFMINFMFSIALLQLQVNREKLIKFYFFGQYEPVSIIFLSLFSILLVLQFVSMIIHRWGTFQHLISSTRILSCRRLSSKEMFEINFQEAKEHIDQPDTQFDSTPDVCELASIDNQHSGEIGENERRRRKSLYEKRFNKNFEKTLRFKSRSRQRLQDVNWKFTVSRNPRKEYISKLYQNANVH